MSEAKRPRAGLGRGLGALLGDIARDDSPDTATTNPAGVRMIPVTSIAPHPGQPRRHFDDAALDELAASIAERGIIQPIVVRPHGHDYQIVAGERRWRAAQRAQLHEVPVVVRDYSDSETLQIALVENIQRQDLNAIEEAQAYSRLIDGTLSMGHARAIIGAPDPEALADQVAAKGLSVRQTERLAQKAKPDSVRHAPSRSRRITGQEDADVAALERQLGDLLGVRIRISHGAHGGTLTLDYSTLDQLDMLCQRLSGEPI